MKDYKEIAREIKNKEDKTDLEYEFLKLRSFVGFVNELLVEESKSHIDSDEALKIIRIYMNDNLDW